MNKTVSNQYTGKNGEDYHKKVHSVPEPANKWIANHRKRKISIYIKENDNVLEYGVGMGWNIMSLKNSTKIGYDIALNLSNILEEHGIHFVSNINELKESSFDVVICHHVIEHVSNPPIVLADIHRLLRKEGKLLLFVPYEKEKVYRKYNPNEPNQHLYSWNVQTLGKLVELNGYKVITGKIREFGYDRFASIWADKLKIGEKGFLILKKIFHFIRPRKEVFILAVKI